MGHEGIVIGILQLGDGCGGGSALRPESVDAEELTVKPVRDSDTFGPIFSCKMYDGRDEYGEEGGSDYTTLLYSSVNPEGFCFNSTTTDNCGAVSVPGCICLGCQSLPEPARELDGSLNQRL